MSQLKPVALVTGSSGFIGYHCCKRLLQDGYRVIGIDAHTNYYDVCLKECRNKMLLEDNGFSFIKRNIEQRSFLDKVFQEYRPDVVVHLAAQAGVRHSVENPRLHLQSNISGVFELLEAARQLPPKHLLLASSSSVYGANAALSYSETDDSDHQLSFYAATKKSMEVMANAYAHLYAIPITACRFFTAYGPWGRPDMAVSKFTSAISNGEAIDVYNFGKSQRDFTYIDDLVHALRLLIDKAPIAETAAFTSPFQVVNIGSSQPVSLDKLICTIENAIGKKALRYLLPIQAGDVPSTLADTSKLKKLTGYVPETNIATGISKYIDWHQNYHVPNDMNALMSRNDFEIAR